MIRFSVLLRLVTLTVVTIAQPLLAQETESPPGLADSEGSRSIYSDIPQFGAAAVVRPGISDRGHLIQVRSRTVSYVAARRVPGCTYTGDLIHRFCAEARGAGIYNPYPG